MSKYKINEYKNADGSFFYTINKGILGGIVYVPFYECKFSHIERIDSNEKFLMIPTVYQYASKESAINMLKAYSNGTAYSDEGILLKRYHDGWYTPTLKKRNRDFNGIMYLYRERDLDVLKQKVDDYIRKKRNLKYRGKSEIVEI